jgi:hypothetical protein
MSSHGHSFTKPPAVKRANQTAGSFPHATRSCMGTPTRRPVNGDGIARGIFSLYTHASLVDLSHHQDMGETPDTPQQTGADPIRKRSDGAAATSRCVTTQGPTQREEERGTCRRVLRLPDQKSNDSRAVG